MSHECKHCEQPFSTLYGLRIHLKTCWARFTQKMQIKGKV